MPDQFRRIKASLLILNQEILLTTAATLVPGPDEFWHIRPQHNGGRTDGESIFLGVQYLSVMILLSLPSLVQLDLFY